MNIKDNPMKYQYVNINGYILFVICEESLIYLIVDEFNLNLKEFLIN